MCLYNSSDYLFVTIYLYNAFSAISSIWINLCCVVLIFIEFVEWNVQYIRIRLLIVYFIEQCIFTLNFWTLHFHYNLVNPKGVSLYICIYDCFGGALPIGLKCKKIAIQQILILNSLNIFSFATYHFAYVLSSHLRLCYVTYVIYF